MPGGGWARITQNLYDKLTDAYREHPAEHLLASRRSLCQRATAKKAWFLGWPQKGFRPIQTIIQEERQAAAASARDAAKRQADEATSVREKARLENIEVLAQERQMLKAARSDVLASLVIAAEVVPAMRQVARAIAKSCEPGPDGSPPAIPPGTAMQLLTRHAQLIQRAVGAAEAVITLSRLDRGAATAHIQLTAEDLSLEQAVEELESLEETLAAVRPKRLDAPDEDEDELREPH